MADPITLGGLALAGSAAGGLLGAVGSVTSGDASASMYQYKAGVAMINKQISDQNAQWALQSGDVSAEEKGLAGGQEIADTKVRQAAGGLDVNSGSNKATRDTQETVSQFDQSMIRWNAAKTAYGYNVKGAEATAEAGMDLQAASQSEKAGWIGALSSVIGGATSVSSKWLQGSKSGMFSGSNNLGSSFMGGGSPSGYGA